MALTLIQPDYRTGSSLGPVCSAEKGKIRRDSFKLYTGCYTGTAGINPKKEMKRISRINYLARVALPMICMTIMIMIFTIGFGISYFLQAVRGSAYGQGRHSPDSRLKNNIGQGSDSAGPCSAYPDKSGQRIFYFPCSKIS